MKWNIYKKNKIHKKKLMKWNIYKKNKIYKKN